MGVIRGFIDFIKDALWITKTCFSSFWFWLPVLFGLYIPLQMWLALAIHPAALLILPGVLAAYMVLIEDKRIAAQYGLKKRNAKNQGAVVWNVKKSVEEYLQIVNKRHMTVSELPPTEELIDEEEEEK